MPSSVHSVNFSCATSDGFVQCGRSFVRGRVMNGEAAYLERFQQSDHPLELALIESAACVARVLEPPSS